MLRKASQEAFKVDKELYYLYVGIVTFLVIATVIGALIKARVKDPSKQKTVKNLNDRIKAWWVMIGVFSVANIAGLTTSVILFLALSLIALKEFSALIDGKSGDLKARQMAFFVLTPLQYLLVWIEWYGMFALLIPVYAFLFIPTLNATQGESRQGHGPMDWK